MNEQELKDALQFYYDNFDEIGVSVYAILRDKENPVKLDIESDALGGLKTLFLDSVQKTVLDNDELNILNLSTSDDRVNAIYLYDVDVPDELSCINRVISTDNLPLMNIADTTLSDVQALLIEIGNNENQVVLYKTMAPINIYGRASFFLKKSKTRLTQIDDEFLRVSPNFQLMKVNDNLFVLDLKSLEKNFGFHEVIKREATLGVTAIETMLLVENTEVLHELIDDVKYARKFTKVVKSSPVIKARIPNQNIINFCKAFPRLIGKIRFNQNEDKILLDTKVSKDLFIKVLMDDFLTSELTKYHYESVAKDSVDEDSNETKEN
ncbi:anti-phage protein KwaB [Malaciobacter mytili]|uniref:anti-phage protein KwaB n=1 Tax=Malaciobacter mytili TaxID=603050 RepID=UPI003A898AAA